MKKILFIFGTRPEAIKMAPLVKEFERRNNCFDVKVCVTAQHREMLDQVLGFFSIHPDYDLNIMKKNQTLFDITAETLKGIESVLIKEKPDFIFVQGDTTTAFTGALAGYYLKIPVVHIEAGLRTGNKLSPFPEEMNRILAGHLAEIHFPPTIKALENLKSEGIVKNVHVSGNTVIDALFLGLDIISGKDEKLIQEKFKNIDFSKKIILVTGHRRESFGKPFENICNALRDISEKIQGCEIVYPVHLNPNIRQTVNNMLSGVKNIYLIEPLDYPDLIWLMNKSYIVLTDSGGIQEEAPSLGKPVLVMREFTERTEGVDAGTAKLVGTDRNLIFTETEMLFNDIRYYEKMSKSVNPYGDGTASKQIADIMEKF